MGGAHADGAERRLRRVTHQGVIGLLPRGDRREERRVPLGDALGDDIEQPLEIGGERAIKQPGRHQVGAAQRLDGACLLHLDPVPAGEHDQVVVSQVPGETATVDTDCAAKDAQPPDLRIAPQCCAWRGGHDLVGLQERRVARAAECPDRVRDGQQRIIDPRDQARVQRSLRDVAQRRAGKGDRLDGQRPGWDSRNHAAGRDSRDVVPLRRFPGRARPVREQVSLPAGDRQAGLVDPPASLARGRRGTRPRIYEIAD